MPPRAMTAISLVPPPMSMIMFPDDAVLHGSDGRDVARRAPDHLARLFAHGDDVVVVADRDHRRFLDDHAAALDVNEDVGRAEVDADLHELGGAIPSAVPGSGRRVTSAPSS